MNDKYVDVASGLSYYGARYYDPIRMGWTQGDPLYRVAPDEAWDDPRRANLYEFSLGNPLVFIDPDGRSPTHFTIIPRDMSDPEKYQHTRTLLKSAINSLGKGKVAGYLKNKLKVGTTVGKWVKGTKPGKSTDSRTINMVIVDMSSKSSISKTNMTCTNQEPDEDSQVGNTTSMGAHPHAFGIAVPGGRNSAIAIDRMDAAITKFEANNPDMDPKDREAAERAFVLTVPDHEYGHSAGAASHTADGLMHETTEVEQTSEPDLTGVSKDEIKENNIDRRQ